MIKKCMSFNTETLNKGVKKSIRIYKNKRSFSKYVEKLITEDMETPIKDALDNFNIDLLSIEERKEYFRCKEQMSKRASLLRLIDYSKGNLSYELQEISNIIKYNDKNL